MVTAAQMKTRFPEAFASTDDAILSAALAEAEAQNDAGEWGSLYETAVLYHAAHLAVTGRSGAASAGISSATAGSVSVSYAAGQDAGRSRFLDLYEGLLARKIIPFAVG